VTTNSSLPQSTRYGNYKNKLLNKLASLYVQKLLE
jgi:hypothetical protein